MHAIFSAKNHENGLSNKGSHVHHPGKPKREIDFFQEPLKIREIEFSKL